MRNEVYKIKCDIKYNFIQKKHCAIFELSDSANRLYDFYLAVSFNKSESFYSIRSIAKYLKLSSKTIIRANLELQEKKYIVVKKRLYGSNTIKLLEKDSKNILDYINEIEKENIIVDKNVNNLLITHTVKNNREGQKENGEGQKENGEGQKENRNNNNLINNKINNNSNANQNFLNVDKIDTKINDTSELRSNEGYSNYNYTQKSDISKKPCFYNKLSKWEKILFDNKLLNYRFKSFEEFEKSAVWKLAKKNIIKTTGYDSADCLRFIKERCQAKEIRHIEKYINCIINDILTLKKTSSEIAFNQVEDTYILPDGSFTNSYKEFKEAILTQASQTRENELMFINQSETKKTDINKNLIKALKSSGIKAIYNML